MYEHISEAERQANKDIQTEWMTERHTDGKED